MEATAKAKLDSFLEEAESWAPKGVFVEVYPRFDARPEERECIDICDHIGCSSNDPNEQEAYQNDFLSRRKTKGALKKAFLDPQFNSIAPEGKAAVINFMENNFDKSGGCVVANGNTKSKHRNIKFVCKRHRQSSNAAKGKKGGKYKTQSVRPLSREDVCNWKFTLFFEPREEGSTFGRYYFFRHGAGNRFHTGHLPMKQHEITKRTSQLDEDELEITEDGLDVNLKSQSMSMMFSSRTGLVVNPKILRENYARKQRRKHYMVPPQSTSDGGASRPMSEAERVIHKLTTSESVSVAYLIANVKVGKDLVTTYTKKRPKKKELTITFESNIANNGRPTETSPVSVAGEAADGDTAEKTATDIYNSLGIDGDTRILLAIAWCTDKQRRLLALFPEAASSDVIFKTNNEKRPSLHIASKTSSNETFAGFYSFLPSQAKWAFDYVWNVLVPSLVDPRFIERNEQMTMDGDEKLSGPFEVRTKDRYTNSKTRGCAFHLFTQGWPANGITTNRVKKGSEAVGVTLLETIKNWALSWTNDVESAEELEVSYQLLMDFLDSDDVANAFDDNFSNDVKEFILKKVWIHRDKFAHYEFMSRRCFGTRTSNDCEIEGGVLKRHSAGPKPCDGMAKSADASCKVSDFRIALKEQKAAKAMDSLPTDVKPEFVPLYNAVTRYSADKIVAKWERSNDLAVFRASDTSFYVKPLAYRNYTCDVQSREYQRYLLPQFERTRVVNVVEIDGDLYLVCSCRGHDKDGYSCECDLAVLDTLPDPKDVAVRWHKAYYRLYLTGDPKFDAIVDELVRKERPGPSLSCDSPMMFRPDLAVGDCTSENHSRAYFESTLPSKGPVLHPGVKWANTGRYASDGNTSVISESRCEPFMQTHVALSQTALKSNLAYAATQDDSSDERLAAAFNQLDSSDFESNDLDTSVVTYATKSPERAPQQNVSARHATKSPERVHWKNVSAMSMCRPKFESICDVIGNDAELAQAFHDELSDFYSRAMAAKRNNSKTVSVGIQSLPATDRAQTSKRLESCPTGNHAAGKAGKKRAARKQPPQNSSVAL